MRRTVKVERMVRMGRMECREVGRVGEGQMREGQVGRMGGIRVRGERGRLKVWGTRGWEG